jgi:hypothetical protein
MGDSLTFDLTEAAERIGGVSEKWLAAQLRSRKIPGRKVGRKWRMTQGDIDACLDIFKVCPNPNPKLDLTIAASGTSVGLTRTSHRRVKHAHVSAPAPQYSLFPSTLLDRS